MTAPKLISIIVVTHQAGRRLYRAIASILEQNAKLEFILVNNGNPPEVEATLVEKFKDVPNIRLMTGHGNIGLVKARNFGARVASGDYLLFLDDDCLLPKNALQKLAQEVEKREEPFLLGARLLDEDGKEVAGSRAALLTPPVAFVNYLKLDKLFSNQRLWCHKQIVPKETVAIPAYCGSFLFGPKALFESYKGFDEHYFQGLSVMDFCFRFAQDGGNIIFAPNLAVSLIGRVGQPFDKEAEKARLAAYRRYFLRNFSNAYPQPILWAVHILYVGVFWAKSILRRNNGVL